MVLGKRCRRSSRCRRGWSPTWTIITDNKKYNNEGECDDESDTKDQWRRLWTLALIAKKLTWSFACTPPSGACPPCPPAPPCPGSAPPPPPPPYPPWCQARPWIMNGVLLRMSTSVITFLPKLILNRMAFINLVEFNYKHQRREIIKTLKQLKQQYREIIKMTTK